MIYTANADKPMRYTDQGETNELCLCRVDLKELPSFKEQARVAPPEGFYTGMIQILRIHSLGDAIDLGRRFRAWFWDGYRRWDCSHLYDCIWLWTHTRLLCAEIRGMLLYQERKFGNVMFDLRNWPIHTPHSFKHGEQSYEACEVVAYLKLFRIVLLFY